MRSLLFASLLLGCKIAFAQTNNFDLAEANKAIPLNNLSFKHIFIKNSCNKTYNFDSQKTLQQVFGKPKKIIKEENEMLGGYYYTYQYKGLEVVFDKYGWDGFTITDNNYALLINGIIYKVGENINKFKKHFPRCFIKKNRTSNSAVQIWIGKSDTSIYVDSDDKDIITSIEMGMNNS